MNADLLLRWMSETGSGEIRDLRQRVSWAARISDRHASPAEIGRWLRDISTLAHAEIDWDGGKWAIAPAVATLLPASGGVAVLAGSRRTGSVERLGEELATCELDIPTRSCSRPLPVPLPVTVQADSIAELRTILATAGIQYVGCAARTLARTLRPISLGHLAAPPSRDDAVEHLAPGERPRFVDGLPDGDGLCRTTIHGRPSYRYRTGEDWFHTDHASGILIDLANRNTDVMRFHAERGTDIGTVFVDQGAALPPLQARTLVLCSGLPVEFGDHAGTMIYRNIPRDIAILVAKSVRQPLNDAAGTTKEAPR